MSLDTLKAVAVMNSLTATFDNRVGASEPFYPEITTERKSTRKGEDYGYPGNVPGVREWIGDRKFKELRAAKFAIENRHWESSLAVKKTDIEDDNMGMYPPLMEELADEATYHPDELVFETLLAGESEPCFDGQSYFDVDHQWGDSGSQSNDLTYEAAADPALPTVAEFAAAYEQARQAMIGFKRDNGKTFIRPTVKNLTGLLLLVPVELQLIANKALFQEVNSGGESNMVLDAPTIITSGFLTDATKFYLFKLDMPLKPLVFQARAPLSRATKGLDDIETKIVKFMTEARYSVGYLAWWTAVLTTFTT
jgi:phage major head subunit gpT-like protein